MEVESRQNGGCASPKRNLWEWQGLALFNKAIEDPQDQKMPLRLKTLYCYQKDVTLRTYQNFQKKINGGKFKSKKSG